MKPSQWVVDAVVGTTSIMGIVVGLGLVFAAFDYLVKMLGWLGVPILMFFIWKEFHR